MLFAVAELLVSSWRPAAILDLMWITLDHLRSAIVGLTLFLRVMSKINDDDDDDDDNPSSTDDNQNGVPTIPRGLSSYRSVTLGATSQLPWCTMIACIQPVTIHYCNDVGNDVKQRRVSRGYWLCTCVRTSHALSRVWCIFCHWLLHLCLMKSMMSSFFKKTTGNINLTELLGPS